jgi:hypothetical protein
MVNDNQQGESTMSKLVITDDSDQWEKGKLGSIEYAEPAPKELDNALDDALDLQQLTMRLQKSLVADLKKIARAQGLGYQPLIRQVLTKYAKEHSLAKA